MASQVPAPTQTAVVAPAPVAPAPIATATLPMQPVQVGASTIKVVPEPHEYTGDLISGGIGLFGGVVGAVVGAWAAYYFGLKAAREANEKAEKARDRQLRFAVTQKLGKIYSAQKEIRKTCDKAVERLSAKRAKAGLLGVGFLDHLSLELTPFATSLTRLSFSPEEVAQVGKGGDLEALKIMMMLDDRHNTTAALLDEFRSLRHSLVAGGL